MLRTLLFLLLIYLTVKVIRRLFFSSDSDTSQEGRSFHRHYSSTNKRRSKNKNIKQRLDEIEDAEFEDVTDPEEKEGQ